MIPSNVSSAAAEERRPFVASSALEAVFATVSYADVFDMPIDVDRLYRFIVGVELDATQVEPTIDQLVAQGAVARSGDLLFLPGRDKVLDVHDERTNRAATMWTDAERWGRRIGRVPFVRMVAVTGGLAVDSVADHDDIDFFIVVRPGRLWLTRLMIIVLGRIAMRDDIELCPNFIVSEHAIEMDDKTLYAARELAQMVAIVGPDVCRDVRRRNAWMFDFLPNATIAGDERRGVDIGIAWWQRAAEAALSLRPFAPFERWEMDRKVTKLRTVRSRRPEVGAPDESSFSVDVCKGHMVGNAAGIDVAWRDRLAIFDA